jgi:hypothetical protein
MAAKSATTTKAGSTTPVKPLTATPMAPAAAGGNDTLTLILGVLVIAALLATILFPFIIK